ncbi:MAG TPA: hypothetical protein VNU93_02285, partial [Verrucomicrobiae bacterium]|nr:hypothetical protein [Verrucomicrobiae bacterium]
KPQAVFGRPLYLAGIIANGIVTLLLAVLLSTNPHIFTKSDSNLLAGIIAILLNAALYYYLSHDNRHSTFAWAGNGLFSSAFVMFAVYLGLTRWEFGLYALGLIGVFLAAERLLQPWEHFYLPVKYCAIASNLFFTLLWVVLIFNNIEILGKFADNLLIGLFALALNSLVYLYLAQITKLPYYTYGATSLIYLILVLFLNWYGLTEIYVFSTPMLLVGVYMFLGRVIKLPEYFWQPLRYWAIAGNILTTWLLFLFAAKLHWVQYSFLTLGLLSNAAAYFYLAWQYKSQWFTWGGFVPAALTYIHFIDYFKIDPRLEYVGLEIMLFALALVGLGVFLVNKGYNFYSRPLMILGYGVSVLGVASGFTNGETLLYPAFLATLLYTVTAYLSPLYREWFWRGALSAANITFGAVLYKVNPHYSLVTYVKYFIVFNLLKFALGFYLQYFENNLKFAWSNYGGVILTSLVSLGITVLSQDFAAASVVWLVYGLLYFALAFLLQQKIATYLSTVVISLGFCYLLRNLGVTPNQLGLYLAGLSFVWIGLGVLLKDYEEYAIPLRYIVPAS